MIKELTLKLNPILTDCNREEYKPLIDRIIELAKLVYKRDNSALKNEIAQEQNMFLKVALNLVVFGVEPTKTEQILQNMIIPEKYSGSDLLYRLLIAEGMSAMQCYESLPLMKLRLYSILGEQYIDDSILL